MSRTPEDERSPYNLPPFNAWREPETWLAYKDGRIKSTVDKIQIPVDHRGFVVLDKYMNRLMTEVFRSEFKWEFNADDPTTWPVEHVLYGPRSHFGPKVNGGDTIPLIFSELPIHKVLFPSMFRSAMLGVSKTIGMPDRQEMAKVIDTQRQAQDEHGVGVFLERYFPLYKEQIQDYIETTPEVFLNQRLVNPLGTLALSTLVQLTRATTQQAA